MIRIALVGNIASGKSTVEQVLTSNGFLVLDTDSVAHILLDNNQEVINAFKDFDILENGKISRETLGRVVFSSKENKKKLENILHPQIRQEILKFFDENSDKKAVFVAIPLLFEAKMEDLFDKIVFVYTDDKIRLNRLIARNNYTLEYAKVRINSQLSQDEKVKKSDIVIFNNSTKEDLEKEVKAKLIEQIR